jgi:hypothetical protein
MGDQPPDREGHDESYLVNRTDGVREEKPGQAYNCGCGKQRTFKRPAKEQTLPAGRQAKAYEPQSGELTQHFGSGGPHHIRPTHR